MSHELSSFKRTETSVLVVEDDPSDKTRVEKALEDVELATYELFLTERLSEAARLVRTQNVEVALLDLGLPESTGVDTIHSFRAFIPNVPIVVLTGEEDEKLGLACIRAGAQDFISKRRMTPVGLHRALQFALSRTREQQILDLKPELTQYEELSSRGAPVSVTAKLSGAAPVRERCRDYDRLVDDYCTLIDAYLEHMLKDTPRPAVAMKKIIGELGLLGAGPRDLLDLHLAALDVVVASTPPSRSYALAVEGRLVAVAMMGMLVDFYRHGLSGSERA